MIEVTRSTGIFVPNNKEIRVNQRCGLVYLFVDGKIIQMKTPVAHKTGFTLIRQANDAEREGEYIILRVDGEPINLLNDTAKGIGASLLRKADDADDFQRNNRKRLNL